MLLQQHVDLLQLLTQATTQLPIQGAIGAFLLGSYSLMQKSLAVASQGGVLLGDSL
jgi:hypothetical protein